MSTPTATVATLESVTRERDAVLRLAQHLASEAIGRRCALVALPGEANRHEHSADRGRCPRAAIGIRWEDGFADNVCEPHAEDAQQRGALVVRPKRHDGEHLAEPSADGR